MKLKLKINTYLTVLGHGNQHFNRPFNEGDEFTPLYRLDDPNGFILHHVASMIRVFVSAERINEVFEQVFNPVKPCKGDWELDEK